MTRQSLTAGGITTALALATVLSLVAVAGHPVAANHADDDVQSYHAEQQDRCIDMEPLGDGETNVTAFYDYRNESSGNFSSHGTTDLQRSQVSQVFVYHGTDGVSLVFLHDSLEWDEAGGAITMSLSGLPADGEWVVEDDAYGPDTDDEFDHDDTSSEIDWMWGSGRTDGGVFRGIEALSTDERVVVDPAFGEASDAYTERTPPWPNATDDVDWHVRTGNGTTVSIATDRELAIGPGPCRRPPQTANLTVESETPAINESVTLDAEWSGNDTDGVAYHWDVDGDGTVETTTDNGTLDHAYAAPGRYNATVTVDDGTGENATASATVTVLDRTPPVARASANRTNVTVGDPVAFDGSNASDNVAVTDAEWTFGDGATSIGQRAVHTYDSPGTYTANLTVWDAAGYANRTAVTVTVAANGTDGDDNPDSDDGGDDPDDGGDGDGSDGDDNDDGGGDGDDGRDGDDDGSDDSDSDDDDSGADGGGSDDDGAGSGGRPGGGSGGGGGAAPPDDSPGPNATVERTDGGAVAIAVGNPAASDTVSVRVPGDGTETPSLRAVALSSSGNPDRMNATLATDSDVDAPDGVDTALLETTVRNASGVHRLTYQFAVDRPGSTTQVLVLREDPSGWTAVDHSVARNESTMLVNVTTADSRPILLAAVQTNGTVGNLSLPATALVGEQVTVAATVSNDERVSFSQTVPLSVDGTVVRSQSVQVPAGETATASYDLSFESVGTRRVAVAGATGTVTALGPDAGVSVAAVDVPRTPVAPGDPVQVSATLRNLGDANGTENVTFGVAGTVVETERVTLAPGEETTVTFTESLDAPGTYAVTVDDERRTVTVASTETANASDTPTDSSTGDSADEDSSELVFAGFGMLVVVAAALSRLV